VLEREGRLPDAVVACVGGGSNAMGAFHEFVEPLRGALLGVEAGGEGVDTARHAATLSGGSRGHPARGPLLVLQDDFGQVRPTHSVSAGLDYPGVGPEHAHLRVRTGSVRRRDRRAGTRGFRLLCELEGIIPALEPVPRGRADDRAGEGARPGRGVVLNLSGRGDKDVDEVARILEGRTAQPDAGEGW
jgi:tryptophan synthase beta subunit